MSELQKSVILKLRQEEATTNAGHGNYTINLKKPVRMEEGDVVKIHTAILDTSADEIVDVVDDGSGVGGIRCKIEVALYNRFWENRNNSAGTRILTRWPFPAPDTNPSSQVPNLRNYICCVGKGVPPNTHRVETFTVYPAGISPDEYGNCTLTFQFMSPFTGAIVTRQKKFKGGHQISHQRGIKMEIGWNVVGSNGLTSFKCIDDHEYLKEHKIDFRAWRNDDVKYGPVVAQNSVNLEPYLQQMEFVIKEGRYTPGEIASIITDEISILNQQQASVLTKNLPNANPPVFPVQNPFLSTVSQINKIAQTLPGNPYSEWFCPMFYRDEPTVPITNVIQYDLTAFQADANANYDIFVGAEQVSLTYDDVLKKLNFDIMHFPMYVGGTGGTTDDANPGIQFNVNGTPITTYGGAMITGLEPVQFWNKQLGFSDLVIDWQSQATSFNTGAGNSGSSEDIFPVQVTPIVGKNITNVYDGLDTVVAHNPTFMIPQTVKPKTNSLTRPILANREFDIALNDEGYFLVEIGFKFPQQMVGGQMANNTNSSMNNIQSIVGKYFTSDNNFVQDQGSGSITYEHHGEPQLLSDLSVRILNPDGSEPTTTDLGVKNSIFLQIVKTLSA